MLKVGDRLFSAVCTTSIIVVHPPQAQVTLECGGQPMSSRAAPPSQAPDPRFDDGTRIGKRYQDRETGLEVMCVAAGEGSLAVDGRALAEQGAKPLPSSD